MNGARAALADAAAVFRSSEFKQVAKDPEEGHSGVRFNGAILTINVKGILSHGIKGGNEEPLFRFNAQYNGNLTKTKASNALSCPKLTSENDGVTGKWMVDHQGRPGFTEVSQEDYRPSPEDGEAFMQELSAALRAKGMG